MTEIAPEEKSIKRHTLMKVILAFLFVCIMFLSIFSSMCPKFVPFVEVPLYTGILFLGIVWIFKAKNKLSVLARFLLASTLGVIVNMGVSYMVHQRVFPYEMYDEVTKQKIEAHKKEMLDNLKKSIENSETKD